MASDFEAVVSKAAEDAGLDPAFVSRLVKAESNWNPSAVSPKGAVGLMQIMPETGKRYGVTNLTDPTQNVRAGIAYLSDLQKKYPGRPDLMAAAYNAGEGAVEKAGGVPNFKETQGYVEKVDPFAKYATPSPPAVAAAKEEDPFAKYVARPPTQTLTPTTVGSEPSTYTGGLLKGLKEGVTGGFAGYTQGIAEGLNPKTAIRGLVQAVTHPIDTATSAIEAITRLPDAVRAAAVDPYEWGREVGQPVGQTMLSEVAPAAMRAVASGVPTGVDMATAIGKGAVKKIGIDPDAMALQAERLQTQATRMRLQAAKSRTRQAAIRADIEQRDIIPLPEAVPKLSTIVEGLPQIAPPPPPNVAPPIAPASIPAAWKPYTGQTELGQVLPPQPPGRTMSGAPQASRPFVPPAIRPPQSPAGAVNMAMKETGVRIPARVMDAAIRRVKAGEDAVDVVKSYAEVK